MSDSAMQAFDERAEAMTVPATIEHLDEVSEFVNERLEQCDCPPKAMLQIGVALEEMYVNVCSYSYAPGVGDCRIEFLCSADPGCATLRLIDTGVPFDPVKRSDPETPSSIQEAKIGGLGIFMTKKSVDELRYERRDNANVVTLVKTW